MKLANPNLQCKIKVSVTPATEESSIKKGIKPAKINNTPINVTRPLGFQLYTLAVNVLFFVLKRLADSLLGQKPRYVNNFFESIIQPTLGLSPRKYGGLA